MTTIMQRSFSGGELSPSLYARVDQVKYQTGARTLKNGYVKKSGGFTNRSGTTFVSGLGASGPGPWEFSNNRFIPWESNQDSETYILVFAPAFLFFVQDGAIVRLSSAPAAYNGATAYVVGDLVSSAGVNYYCVAATTGNAPPNVTYWHALVDDLYSIPNPFGTYYDDIQFVQDAARMTFVNSRSLTRDLIRTSHTNWYWSTWAVDGSSPTRYGLPIIAAPTGVAASGGGSGGASYVVTAIGEDGEESLSSSRVNTVTVPSAGTPVTVSWNAVTGATGYNIYAFAYDVPLLIYFVAAASLTFLDTGYTRNVDAENPPETRSDLNTTTGTYPSRIGKFQQRTILSKLSPDTQIAYASKTGFYKNFTKKEPLLDDGSLTFKLNGKRLSGIRHIIDVGALVIFADTGEWIVKGNSNGAITPSSCTPEQYSYNGSSDVQPIVIGSEVMYVQTQGSIIRSLGFDINGGGRDGYRDADMTAFADHLVEGKTILNWAYQKTPNSILWIVLDDGSLISMTYIRDQQILAFCRHETDGIFEDVACVPEGNEYAVYFSIKRTINGNVKHYIERMVDRNFTDIVDAIFLDSALSYDGRNTGAATMTLSGGTTWDYDETLTLTASAATFSAGDVGNEIWITGTDDVVYRCAITAYTNTTVVSVKPDKLVPSTSGIRTTATTNWARAVDEVSGLSHLEAKEVGVFADGYVIANPNNAQYGTALTVASGAITLPECHSVIHVGLPYISDIETLDIDTAQGETIADKKRLVNKVTMHTHNTRGVWVGGKPPTDDDTDPLENLAELKLREDEDWATPTRLVTDVNEVIIDNSWNSNGRVFIRQIDPLPMTILSIAPTGLFPFRGGA